MKFTPTKEQQTQDNRRASTRSPLSPIVVISPNCTMTTNNRNSPSRFSKNFSTPQPISKISKFSPKSAASKTATTQKKKRLNFNSPSVKKLLDKIAKKSTEAGGETSNLKRLKRLIFRKKGLQQNKENFEATEYTFTECSDDGSFYFGTEMSSEGELSEEELDYAFGLDHQEFGMMSPKRPSALASASRSSINPNERRGFSLQHLFKKREEIKKAEEIIENFDIAKQLEMSVADTILDKWAHLNKH